ncbi:MAG TPA: DUF1543 domain-containing protein [Oligoflexus sp.]|uniref:DUF1543 domain-containing protein n=1 Tax=Oligoflexus sp. TaxID=1971216 RepID=UPI002D80FA4F|nr:DUF1543 domain-containing protein [Oligoflexus sp.]HET9239868.1 DUF1543 domain-containing protein [Oligoflexus sp.]
MKRLYMVHCGYYDPSVGQGLFENHTNFFVCAEDFEDARAQARENAEFKRLKMHIDGLMEIETVSGHRVILQEDKKLAGVTRTRSLKYGSRTPKMHEY